MKKMIIAVLGIVMLASCKKEKTITEPEVSVTGFWKGKFGTGTATPQYGYAFLFRSNGTVRVFNASDTTLANKAEGTYTKNGTTVTSNYEYIGLASGVKYAASASLSVNNNRMEGTWGESNSASRGGTFFVDRQ